MGAPWRRGEDRNVNGEMQWVRQERADGLREMISNTLRAEVCETGGNSLLLMALLSFPPVASVAIVQLPITERADGGRDPRCPFATIALWERRARMEVAVSLKAAERLGDRADTRRPCTTHNRRKGEASERGTPAGEQPRWFEKQRTHAA